MWKLIDTNEIETLHPGDLVAINDSVLTENLIEACVEALYIVEDISPHTVAMKKATFDRPQVTYQGVIYPVEELKKKNVYCYQKSRKAYERNSTRR